MSREATAPDIATVGDLFSRCELLTPGARLALAEQLHIVGRAPAVFPEDLARTPLLITRDDLAETTRLIGSGLSNEVASLVPGERLGRLVPRLETVFGALDSVNCPTRLRSVLARERVHTWADLAPLTIDSMLEWCGVGDVFIASVLGLAVAAVATSFEFSVEESTPATTLRAHLEEILAAAGDIRDRAVFEHHVIGLQGAPNVATLARALGVGSERVRQLRRGVEERVHDAARARPVVLQAAKELADELGTAAPLHAVEAAWHELDNAWSPDDSRARLLLWLAGPLRLTGPREGWVALEPDELVAMTRQLLAEDGGVRPIKDVVDDLCHFGLTPEHALAWIADQRVRVVDDLVVLATGTDVAIAERALSANGRAMSLDELTSWIGRTGDSARVWAALSSDRRFVRTAPRSFELAEWGAPVYDPPLPLDMWPAPVATGGGDDFELRIDIDASTFAGVGGVVPDEWAWALGLASGDQRALASRFGPLHLIYDGAVATRGSLRPIARAVGAVSGDVIILRLRPQREEVDVSLLRYEAVSDNRSGVASE